MKRLAVAFALLFAASVPSAMADQNPQLTTTQLKATMTGAFAIPPGLAKTGNRQGCLIQNNGTHTLFVFFGGASAPADTSTSFQVPAAGTIQCLVGANKTIVDNVWIEGTTSDVVVYSYQ